MRQIRRQRQNRDERREVYESWLWWALQSVACVLGAQRVLGAVRRVRACLQRRLVQACLLWLSLSLHLVLARCQSGYITSRVERWRSS